MRFWTLLLCLALGLTPAHAAKFYVSTSGSDTNSGTQQKPWRTIQHACDRATPGSTLNVAKGVYNEKITFKVSGTSSAGYITLLGAEGAVISGAGKAGSNLITIQNLDYIRVIGFELRDNTGVKDGSAIRVEGGGKNFEFRNNKIHNILGKNAMGITIYGTNGSKAISNLLIDGNEIYDCQPAPSEALTLNGNVGGFQISNNFIHNVNNIGIDMIGGEKMCPNPANDAARQGTCTGNRVFNANSPDQGGYAGGIYVDGGHDIVIDRNLISQCDVGLAVGAENKGIVTKNVTVRNNIIYQNQKRGLSFGGYDSSRGRVTNCRFLNNTCWQNDSLKTGDGELHIEYASENVVKNNIFAAGPQNLLVSIVAGGVSNSVDNNLYFAATGKDAARFFWRDDIYTGFDKYRLASQLDAESNFADPVFQNAGAADFHLGYASSAVNAGDPDFKKAIGETDFDGKQRLWDGRVDAGAFEKKNFTPINRSASPSPLKSAAEVSNTLTTSWRDDDGMANIEQVRFLIATTRDTKSALYAVYNAVTNKIYLGDDAGTDWASGSGIAPGTALQLQNTQGTLDVANTIVTRSSNQISVQWAFTPRTSFAGKKNLFLSVTDLAGAQDGWEDKGDWNITKPTTQTSVQTF